MIIKSLRNLIKAFESLPGISKKQAEKISYDLLNDEGFSKGQELIWAIEDIRKKIKKCITCGNFSEENICEICNDKQRQKILVIIESPIDIWKIEDTSDFKPYYHVLHGLVNKKNIEFENLNISNLIERAKGFKEVILALSPNLEGIVTSNYIKRFLPTDIKITQLAQGIPLGAAMDYVDGITLRAALNNRKEVK